MCAMATDSGLVCLLCFNASTGFVKGYEQGGNSHANDCTYYVSPEQERSQKIIEGIIKDSLTSRRIKEKKEEILNIK